jgi:hypothetical protein
MSRSGSRALEVVLDGSSAAWVAEHAADLTRSCGRFIYSIKRFSSREEACEQGCDPHVALAPLGEAKLQVSGLPACVTRASQPLAETPELSLEALDPRGGLDLPGLVEHYLRGEYGLYAARCASCALRTRCPGMPIQHARWLGLDRLRPRLADTGETN